MSNLSTFRSPNLKTANGSLTYSASTGNVTYVAPTKLSQFTNDAGFVSGTVSQFNSNSTIVQRQFNGRIEASAMTLLGSGQEINAGIELGSQTTSSIPYIDFHSSGFSNDYDVRIVASGGSNGVVGSGTLNFNGSNMVFNAPVAAGASQTGQSLVNIYLAETGHATSRRASLQLGTGWQIGQDLNTNGTRDFYIYNSNASTNAFYISTPSNNASFAAQVSMSSLNLLASGSSTVIYTDLNSNNVVVRAGPSSAYRYTVFQPSGTLSVPGDLAAANGYFVNDVHANRGNNTGYYYAGNANNAYYGFDGSNSIIRAGGSGNVYKNNDSGTYLMWDSANINPVTDIRLVFAGDQNAYAVTVNAGNNIWEPYAGATVTGQSAAAINGVYAMTGARWRYVQKKDSSGNWYTVVYA